MSELERNDGVVSTAVRSANPLVRRLSVLDTCAVSDALDRVGIAGVAFGLQRLAGSRRFAGRSITVTLRLAEGRTSQRHLCTAAVDMAGAGDVIVVQHHEHKQAAGWGGILSFAAKRNGVEGVVIDGMCRDIDEAVDLGLPVVGVGAVPATARGRVVETAFQEPIVVRGIRVQPGDYVLSDRSGVVFVRATRAEEVIGIAESLVTREKAMVEKLRAGEPTSQVMGHAYENMLGRD